MRDVTVNKKINTSAFSLQFMWWWRAQEKNMSTLDVVTALKTNKTREGVEHGGGDGEGG